MNNYVNDIGNIRPCDSKIHKTRYQPIGDKKCHHEAVCHLEG